MQFGFQKKRTIGHFGQAKHFGLNILFIYSGIVDIDLSFNLFNKTCSNSLTDGTSLLIAIQNYFDLVKFNPAVSTHLVLEISWLLTMALPEQTAMLTIIIRAQKESLGLAIVAVNISSACKSKQLINKLYTFF